MLFLFVPNKSCLLISCSSGGYDIVPKHVPVSGVLAVSLWDLLSELISEPQKVQRSFEDHSEIFVLSIQDKPAFSQRIQVRNDVSDEGLEKCVGVFQKNWRGQSVEYQRGVHTEPGGGGAAQWLKDGPGRRESR